MKGAAVPAETPPTWDAPDMVAVSLDGSQAGDATTCPVCLDAPAGGADWRRFRCGHGMCYACLVAVRWCAVYSMYHGHTSQVSARLDNAAQATCPLCRQPVVPADPPAVSLGEQGTAAAISPRVPLQRASV